MTNIVGVVGFLHLEFQVRTTRCLDDANCYSRDCSQVFMLYSQSATSQCRGTMIS
jgi:hypothetical protein